MTYVVRMCSGQQFSWIGDPVADESWNTVCGFLVLPGGTLLNLAHIESMTPVGASDGEPTGSLKAQ